MNSVILSGRLVYDPSLKGEALRNKIAIRRSYKNKEGKIDTDFVAFTAWGTQAQYILAKAKKGSYIELSGSWRVDEADGRLINYLVVNEAKVPFTNLQSTDNAAKEPEDQKGESFDDLPF